MSNANFLEQLLQDELGATAIEYGLILALIAIAMITALQGMATSTLNMWNGVETKVKTASSNARS
ncbi:Flp family type IVb pilin [Aurantiacibacter sediminis]|uniref:Flp family type IVb pilin n=1 Tax=Aurantiacibacter sediminis TaxID=2793064 RepID=A0ABS0N4B9_9SPHN|nr:Flp family type IVb pilin [Aurantiacibacter sediminis]MBH5322822.1 Flp family type IVb pilin [Aurantiacibacter sediminis]